MRFLGAVLLTFSLAGCFHLPRFGGTIATQSQAPIQLVSHTEKPTKRVVYVMSNGFHTGIVLRREDVPLDVWPEVAAIPDHPWVEVGWGSEIFYRAKSITVPVVMGAMVPNPSVLHIVGWEADPEQVYARMDLIKLEVTPAEFAALCQHITDSYETDSTGHILDLGPGIHGDGKFFRARGSYYFPKTCNVWTARGLQSAGLPIAPELCGAADAVLFAARSAGTTIHRR